MGVQLFPALQDYDKYHFWEPSLRQVDWKSVPHHLEELDTLAAKLGIESLYRFINTTRDDTPFDDETMDGFESDGELIDEAWYYQGQMLWSVELKWFDPGQGLITVRHLISYLHSVQGELEINQL
ncbi:hypothetical protein C7B65_21160 [Phormidesmis priestleyi ULC007]|uniref:Uncharacterized protein n=1 Tax=Phormidesmis priestleyi ULC007 TaxID=1920490 RepID=A0A2T1D865_9CYAN|nr:hypothetical protein [Phormidesmis priestleyi]PSB16636.1 hypothetical protein C7B65_21160 [Phormidesmis priestleyi ULC007]PZO47538.1 MAG: hypothetical protein DCF14_19695 [Phormidesmis priestleyi]